MQGIISQQTLFNRHIGPSEVVLLSMHNIFSPVLIILGNFFTFERSSRQFILCTAICAGARFLLAHQRKVSAASDSSDSQ
jgi:hypothetical protein